MEQVTRTLHVSSDPERVIAYIADVENHPAFIGPLASVSNVSGDPRTVGTTWDWTFVMVGIQVEGHGETTEYEAGKVFAFKTDGVDSTFSYRVEPEESGSHLEVSVTYDIPDLVLVRVANRAVILNWNESEANAAARNLRTILEG